MTAYYVSTTGSDSNDGLSEGTAFLTPGYASSQATAVGDVIYIKADGTYTTTNQTQNTSNGPMLLSAGVSVEGYGSTVGDGTKAVLNNGSQDYSGGAYGYITSVGGEYRGTPNVIRHLDFQMQNATEAYSGIILNVSSQTACYVMDCDFTGGILGGAYGIGDRESWCAIRCRFLGGSGSAFYEGNLALNCYFTLTPNNTGALDQFNSAHGCVFKNCGGASVINNSVTNCIFYNEDAYKKHHPVWPSTYVEGTRNGSVRNCIFWGFDDFGKMSITAGTNPVSWVMTDCLYGNFNNLFESGSTAPLDTFAWSNVQEVLEDPFVDAANNDFRIDMTKAVSSQVLGMSGLGMTGVTGGIAGFGAATYESSEPDAHYPFRFAASGDFESDVAKFHPLRENR